MKAKIADVLAERRKYVRLQAPIDVSYTVDGHRDIHKASIKNISSDGLRFESHNKALKEDSLLEIALNIPEAPNPVHAKGKVVWKKKISLEDRSPSDFGIEFTAIEEDNKNTFLKFLCDLIYDVSRVR